MTWITRNMLKCNPSKMEVVHFYSRYTQPNCSSVSIKVGGHQQEPLEEVRDLGVTLDSNLTFKAHINKICRWASESIHFIGKIRKFLTQKDTERLVHAFSSSNLDYCNGMLHGFPSCDLQKLQRIQNTAARLVVREKSVHITPILFNLHWLPVQQRIIFKLLLVIFKTLNGFAPNYIADLFHQYTTARKLRSSNRNFLAIPKTRTERYGDKSFSCAALLSTWFC